MENNQPYETLDPENWEEMRALAHRMVDDALTYLETVRDVERRIQQAEANAKENPLPDLDRPHVDGQRLALISRPQASEPAGCLEAGHRELVGLPEVARRAIDGTPEPPPSGR